MGRGVGRLGQRPGPRRAPGLGQHRAWSLGLEGAGLIRYAYDRDGRLTDIYLPSGDQTTYGYHANGWLAACLTTAADGTIYGWYDHPARAHQGYDASGNPLQASQVRATLDGAGALLWAASQWRARYDPLGQLAELDAFDGQGWWLWELTLDHTPNGALASQAHRGEATFLLSDYDDDAASR